jgi:myo-inositol 2-dehydrogenase / D-chiro-inositol 1-dehydrogenase
MEKLKIAQLGVGSHSQINHLTSAARYVEQHPGEIELVGLCDLREQEARAAAEQYGFARVYTDLGEMLEVEKPDGCIAITPLEATLPIATQVVRTGIPLLMEKPPGVDLAETQQIVDLVEATGSRVMVSVNRRFDVALQKALSWRGDRPLEYLRATMIRHRRVEPTFMTGTAIHAVDAMRHIAGDVRDYTVDVRMVSGAWWYVVQFEFTAGTHGTLEVLTTGGRKGEQYELFGPDYSVSASVADFDAGGMKAWENGDLVVDEIVDPELPSYVRNGAYGELVEFIASLREDRAPRPTPADVLQSVEICDALQRIADKK